MSWGDTLILVISRDVQLYYGIAQSTDCADSKAARSIDSAISIVARSTDRCAINGSIDGAAQSMDRANPSIARNKNAQLDLNVIHYFRDWRYQHHTSVSYNTIPQSVSYNTIHQSLSSPYMYISQSLTTLYTSLFHHRTCTSVSLLQHHTPVSLLQQGREGGRDSRIAHILL